MRKPRPTGKQRVRVAKAHKDDCEITKNSTDTAMHISITGDPCVCVDVYAKNAQYMFSVHSRSCGIPAQRVL
jgi:hypothetical protein